MQNFAPLMGTIPKGVAGPKFNHFFHRPNTNLPWKFGHNFSAILCTNERIDRIILQGQYIIRVLPSVI